MKQDTLKTEQANRQPTTDNRQLTLEHADAAAVRRLVEGPAAVSGRKSPASSSGKRNIVDLLLVGLLCRWARGGWTVSPAWARP